MTFLESGGKTGQDRYVLKIIYEFRNLFVLLSKDSFDLNLTWVRYENECHHRILRSKWLIKYVSHDTRAIFSCGDLIWPDIDFDLYLALASYLHGIFVIPSVAFWQGLGLQRSLVWSRQPIKAIRFSFEFAPHKFGSQAGAIYAPPPQPTEGGWRPQLRPG